MKWSDIYPSLLEKKSKELCVDIAIACCDLSIDHAVDESVFCTLNLIKKNANKKDIDASIQAVAIIRMQAKDDIFIRESAHIVLHAAEVAISNSYQSASGHASRCVDALSRIYPEIAAGICEEYLSG